MLLLFIKIFICASKHFYDKVPAIKLALEAQGNVVHLPNGFDNPALEAKLHSKSPEEHSLWKAGMLRKDKKIISQNDAILVLNFEKHGIQNYIGGSVFLEMYIAFDLGKKIFLLNVIPEGLLKDEILGINPKVIIGNLSKIE